MLPGALAHDIVKGLKWEATVLGHPAIGTSVERNYVGVPVSPPRLVRNSSDEGAALVVARVS